MWAIITRLKAMIQRSRDLKVLTRTVTDIIRDANTRRALSGLDYRGRPYAALKKSTVQDRLRQGYPPGPPLVRAGPGARVIAGMEIRIIREGDTLRFLKDWPTVDWLIYHIRGSKRLPKRDPSGYGKDEIARIRKLLVDHLISVKSRRA
jgi:hypothetical protein